MKIINAEDTTPRILRKGYYAEEGYATEDKDEKKITNEEDYQEDDKEEQRKVY